MPRQNNVNDSLALALVVKIVEIFSQCWEKAVPNHPHIPDHNA